MQVFQLKEKRKAHKVQIATKIVGQSSYSHKLVSTY